MHVKQWALLFSYFFDTVTLPCHSPFLYSLSHWPVFVSHSTTLICLKKLLLTKTVCLIMFECTTTSQGSSCLFNSGSVSVGSTLFIHLSRVFKFKVHYESECQWLLALKKQTSCSLFGKPREPKAMYVHRILKTIWIYQHLTLIHKLTDLFLFPILLQYMDKQTRIMPS